MKKLFSVFLLTLLGLITSFAETAPKTLTLEQNDSSTPLCTIRKEGDVTVFTTVDGFVNVVFKMLNVDVTGYNQVRVNFAEETTIPTLFSVGTQSVDVAKAQKVITYDIPSGTTKLQEVTLVTVGQATGVDIKVENVQLVTAAGITHTIQVGALTRSYDLYIPKTVGKNPPMVFSLHGAGGHSSDFSPFGKAEADKKGCIVVYPQGVNQNFGPFGIVPGWDATGEKNIDYDFFLAILKDVKEQGVAYDEKRVYCCGFSNGGMMTYAMWNAASDIFAAFASISGFQMNEFHHRHTGRSPRPFLHIHGANDNFVDIAHMPTIRDNMVARLGANPVPKTTAISGKYTRYTYEASENGFPYIYYVIDGMGHNTYTSNTPQSNSTLTMWNFLSQYSLDDVCDTTLKWNPNLDVEGYDPSEHGWTVTNAGKRLTYGDTTPTGAPNVSHSLQFEPGNYELRVETTGTVDNKVTISLKNVTGSYVFSKSVAVGEKTSIPFTIKKYGEFTITIIKKSADDKFVTLSAHTASPATSVRRTTDNGQQTTDVYGLDGVKRASVQPGVNVVDGRLVMGK